jgi:predicted DsbA family dithiol-disulfide isomerase
LVWRPFDLHPEYPPEGIPFAELDRRYGGGVADRHRAMFDQAGLPYVGTLEKIPNSRSALMLAELARDHGAFDALHPRLFEAYWARGRDIGDAQVLLEEGAAAGLDEGEILEALRQDSYLERIEAYTRAAIELGAGGVPAWLIDERFLVPGAQPHEVFEQVLERLGHEPPDGA